MGKRHIAGAFLIAALALFGLGCEESSEGGGFSLAEAAGGGRWHRWDLMLTNLDLSASEFTVTVTTAGGSGAAVVSIQDEDGFSDSRQVWAGVPIPLGNCGFTVTFADLGGFNLALGDAWVVMTVGGMLAGPAYPTTLPQGSTGVAAVPGGANTCVGTCSTGLFEGLPDVPSALAKAFPGFQLPPLPLSLAPAVPIKTSAYLQEGDVPEVYLLSFSTLPTLLGPSPVAAGDQIQAQYTRRINSDAADGDFFAARLSNHRSYEFIEYLSRRQMRDDETRTVTFTAPAEGDFLGLDFVVGLSGPADYVALDDVTVSVNGVPLLLENFEGAALALGPFLWLDVIPAQALGSVGFTAQAGEVLSGAQSYLFRGGRLFHQYGQAFSQGGLQAAEFTMTDGSVDSTYWLGSFLGASLGSALAGSYGGHNFDSSCRETGMFFVNKDATGVADGGGAWQLLVEAELKHCDPGLSYAETVFPETAYAVNLIQVQTAIGGLLQADTVVTDGQGNQVQLMGMVLGSVVMLQMTVTAPAMPGGMIYSGAFSGSLTETDAGAAAAGTVMGVASPNLLFPPDTCDLSGSFSAAITH